MTGKIRSYRDLDVWKLAIDIVKDVYGLTRSVNCEVRTAHDAIRTTT
jgi:hypothetical protein